MTDAQVQEKFVELAESGQRVDRQLTELARQIGGLSNKFGSFTEGLAYTSCKRILKDRFGMEGVSHEVEVERKDGRNAEYDMIGEANGSRNEVVVVEMKSHLRDRDIEQFQKQLLELTDYLPKYRGMKIHGLLAAVYLPKGMAERVAEAGLYLATGSDENFSLVPPPLGFQPVTFGG